MTNILRSTRTLLSSALLSIAVLGCQAATHGTIPAAKVDDTLAAKPGRETAIFAGGCFWGTQAVFQRVRGVISTTAGYDGGLASTATYDQVTTETTNHAESVKVVFDPSRITFGKLLQIFFAVHDPTTLNRQGNDVGTSYRSAIFFTTPDQQRIAQAYIAQLDEAHAFPHKIVTAVTKNTGFFDGEDYHQDYALKNPNDTYILVCDRPKIATLKSEFPDLFVEYTGKK
ncbi:peptide-methionine (S)-S-oxide reductase [Bryocella elongata]|uniref:Peptide methionine sulfoxide reductase MsrA n=1 Tax=Bryocella elongata TaxID=863522 RepID=A0A1H6BQG4_9BACT|nr:peptide-methionine (S)-S-oxide reductase MsrA [Bryocella elongata]SEG62872.1 peptide-methionine (S)-S-oxide reductase [Bryocella elongata]